MQIQQDFGIIVPGSLALSIDKYRLPLCSSTAVLRDDDVLTVSLSSERILAIENGNKAAPTQDKPQKKRKRNEPDADAPPAGNATGQARAKVSDTDESETPFLHHLDAHPTPAYKLKI